MKYEVDHTWGGAAWPGAGDDGEEPTPERLAQTIMAVYEDAAIQGGRIIATHTLILSGREHIFFVRELPDEPAPASTSDES
jgi:hypothetical protein